MDRLGACVLPKRTKSDTGQKVGYRKGDDMKIGDPIMRMFKRSRNWIGIITWINLDEEVVRVKWTHGLDDVHHLSVLTPVKKCP